MMGIGILCFAVIVGSLSAIGKDREGVDVALWVAGLGAVVWLVEALT